MTLSLVEYLEPRPGLAVGDTVYLKSGSPPLTVTAVADGMVEVAWVALHGHIQTSQFPAACVSTERVPFHDEYWAKLQ